MFIIRPASSHFPRLSTPFLPFFPFLSSIYLPRRWGVVRQSILIYLDNLLEGRLCFPGESLLVLELDSVWLSGDIDMDRSTMYGLSFRLSFCQTSF